VIAGERDTAEASVVNLTDAVTSFQIAFRNCEISIGLCADRLRSRAYGSSRSPRREAHAEAAVHELRFDHVYLDFTRTSSPGPLYVYGIVSDAITRDGTFFEATPR